MNLDFIKRYPITHPQLHGLYIHNVKEVLGNGHWNRLRGLLWRLIRRLTKFSFFFLFFSFEEDEIYRNG